MSEKKNDDIESLPSSETPTPQVEETPVTNDKSDAEPNEAFFGALLIGCLVLSFLAATAYFGYSGYRYFKAMKAEETIPSISLLPNGENKKSIELETTEKKEIASDPAIVAAVAVDKKKLEIKVLNGGTAKGIAGTYTEKLKKGGFIKATVGNSVGDYTGATIYFAKGQETGMTVLKETVQKDYPTVSVKEAESGNKDTIVAAIVLILGK